MKLDDVKIGEVYAISLRGNARIGSEYETKATVTAILPKSEVKDGRRIEVVYDGGKLTGWGVPTPGTPENPIVRRRARVSGAQVGLTWAEHERVIYAKMIRNLNEKAWDRLRRAPGDEKARRIAHRLGIVQLDTRRPFAPVRAYGSDSVTIEGPALAALVDLLETLAANRGVIPGYEEAV